MHSYRQGRLILAWTEDLRVIDRKLIHWMVHVFLAFHLQPQEGEGSASQGLWMEEQRLIQSFFLSGLSVLFPWLAVSSGFCKITTILFMHIAWGSPDHLQSGSVAYCQEPLYVKRLLCSLGWGEWQGFRASKYVPRAVCSCVVHLKKIHTKQHFITSISEEHPKFT